MIQSPSSRSSPPINLSRWLAAANDHAWSERAPTAPNHHSFAHEAPAQRLIAASSPALTFLDTARAAPTNARCTRRSQPNPHSAR